MRDQLGLSISQDGLQLHIGKKIKKTYEFATLENTCNQKLNKPIMNAPSTTKAAAKSLKCHFGKGKISSEAGWEENM